MATLSERLRRRAEMRELADIDAGREPPKNGKRTELEWEAADALDAMEAALEKAGRLANIATDWNLDEVEIDGEMVSTYNLRDEFAAALAMVRK